jgi:cell division protease FtsH
VIEKLWRVHERPERDPGDESGRDGRDSRDERDPREFRDPRDLRDPRRGFSRAPGPRGPLPKRDPGRYSRAAKSMAFWVVLMLLMFLAFRLYYGGRPQEVEISYTQFMAEVKNGNVKSISIVEKEVRGQFGAATTVTTLPLGAQTTTHFKLYLPAVDPNLPEKVWEHNAKADISSKPPGFNWFSLLLGWLPILLILGFWIFIMRQMQTGGNKAFSFGKSKAKLITSDRPKVTFEDVAGAQEAKEELQEIIEFLKEPQKFNRLGGKIPKGALLLGAPGTGKTLLAKAVAGEAGVPFFSMSGSDFVEMFVGVGASRVRDLFEQGKKHAPCIIFIDEIDAVGRHRGAGLGGGHDEREQTLNQLLVEMDGFHSNEGVILIAATNRPDVLDPALLRPGRLDRQIVVDLPDLQGREGILHVHTRKIPLAKDVDLKRLARGTPGMSGADLANMANEAALLAARKNHTEVTSVDFEAARDKVMMGTERKSLMISEEEKRGTAYHEAGHAIVAGEIPEADPLHKVTIIPRGRALGVTTLLPLDEKHKWSKVYCLAMMAMTMGGRAAEMLIFKELSTGARDDIEKATNLARKMVCEWGMSDILGPVTYGQKEEQIFLGREIAQHRDYSEQTAITIDNEVRTLVDGSYQRALDILEQNVDKLHALAHALLEREILDSEEIKMVLEGKPLPPRAVDSTPTRKAEEEAVAQPSAEKRAPAVERRAPNLAPGESPS